MAHTQGQPECPHGAGGAQLGLAMLTRTEDDRPAGPNRRAGARARAGQTIRRCANPDDRARAEAMDQVKAHLRDYLDGLALGETFQAADFNEWMLKHGLRPNPSVYDPRAIGGVFVRLTKRCVLMRDGFRPNRGSSESNYNSTPRTVYRLVRRPSKGEL